MTSSPRHRCISWSSPRCICPGLRRYRTKTAGVVARIFEAIPKIAAGLGLSDYRIVTNNGPDAGQTVSHLHFHVLAGGKLGEMA